MIGVYYVGGYTLKENEAGRNLAQFKVGETENFEAIKVIGDHANRQIVIDAYKAKGVEVISDVRKKEVQEAKSEPKTENEVVEPVKKATKRKKAD